MGNPFAWIDGRILALHQFVANEVQYRYDRNCFWLGRICMLSVVLILLLLDLLGIVFDPMHGMYWLGMALLVTFWHGLVSLLIAFAERYLASGTRNRFEPFWWLRLGGVAPLAWCIVGFEGLFLIALGCAFFMMSVGLYFFSCTPLPPGSKRPEKSPTASRVRFSPVTP